MRRISAFLICGAVLALAGLAGPSLPGGPIASPLVAVDRAEAAETKSLAGGGSGNVASAGERFGDLLSGWGVPILIAVAGFLLVGSLVSRNVGAAIGIVVITLVGLIFFASPQSIESAAKGIAGIVF